MLRPEDLRQPVPSLGSSWFWGPNEYTSWQDEQLSWKNTCYIGDWSFLWEWRFSGPQALDLIADHSVNSFADFAVGQAKHTIQCNDDGHVVHEGILLRLGEEEFMNFGMGGMYLAYQLQVGDYEASAAADDWFNYQVSGPNAIFLLEELTGKDLRDVAFMHACDVTVAGHEIKALRQGMAGEIGYELMGPREHAGDVQAAVVEVGQRFGLRQMGGRVAMINHLEACFPSQGIDYLPAILNTPYYDHLVEQQPFLKLAFRVKGSFQGDRIDAWCRNPVELGWGKNVKFDHDFIGRSALEKEVADPKRAIVTLVWNAEDVIDVYGTLFAIDGPRYEYMEIPKDERFLWVDRVLLPNGDDIGATTSRGFSEHFRQMLSLCTIDVAYAVPGTDVIILWGDPGKQQKQIRAVVAPAPYKQDNRRIDVSALPLAPPKVGETS